MKTLEVSRDVLPIGKFKARVSELVKRVRLEKRPLVVTLNGEPAAVLIPPEDFDRVAYHQQVRLAIEEGLADVESGRSMSDDELTAWADERYGRAKRTRR